MDAAGLESKPSNEVDIRIDLTGPNARIRSPQAGSGASSLVDIKGMAYSAGDFKQYRVSIGQGVAPSTWNTIRTSPLPVSYGVLAQWDTLGLGEGQVYSIKLEAEDLSGNITAHQISVTIDNTPPAAPLLISAAGNVSDVTVTWQANTETDLAGYLLYRNDQLANVTGIVVGDLKPYLISGTSYLGKALPDGTIRYYLIAVDQAGNMSSQSNTLEVTIDTHPPHAVISDPADGSAIGGRVIVKADSPDLDIATVQFQFQYQAAQDTTWTNLGSPVTSATIATNLDPAALGLSYGTYRLRAAATDQGQKTDPNPGYITVAYTDLTPPAAPQGLGAKTIGGTATLTWSANTESDLYGYNVYRTSGSARTRINPSLLMAAAQPSYQDSGLTDGAYIYEVTAVDASGNESRPSGSTGAKVYAPVITQPYTPVGQSSLQFQGTNAAANSIISIFDDTGSGRVSLGMATADATGVFAASAVLAPGENRITAHATDGAGNISEDSVVVTVVYNDTPGAPTGLTAPVQDHDVHLAWNPNSETDILGYYLYRDGVKVLGPDAAVPFDVTASSSFDVYNYSPWAATDNDQNTYWMPQDGTSAANPAWWEMDLATPELISHLEIHWGTDLDSSGNEVAYAGKDFEIRVWSADANAWITQAKVTGNTVKSNAFDFKPSYRTDKIRVFITDTTDLNSMKQVRIAEVGAVKDNPVSVPSYDDLNLADKQFAYTVTAVDQYGFESPPSDTVNAVVGDIVPPSAPQGLAATSAGSDIILTWSPNPEPDVAGYNVYRNTAQGWAKITASLAAGPPYTDANLLNGAYTYRITAVDAVGNESRTSNEATATLSVALPASARLNVAPTPDGGLAAAWTYEGSPPAGFNLYRSTSAGGPYTRVNGALITGSSYLDNGLTSGMTYFYVVAAVDGAGNIGVYSNEASGTPLDTVAPSKPVILMPTVAGAPITLFTGTTNVSGTADPDTFVDLFRNGTFVGRKATQLGGLVQKWPLDHDGNIAALSPDGNTLAYTLNDYIWFKSLVTGAVTQAFQATQCYTLVWSPEGKKIAYTYYDSSWNLHIGIYDVSSGSTTLLPTSIGGYEDSPSWSPDGTRLAFVEHGGTSPGIRFMDLATGTTSEAISSSSAYNARLSPDGKLIAYTDSQGLSLFDLAGNAARLVDGNADWYNFEWSYDGSRLAFVSYRSDPGAVYVLNVVDGTQTLVPGSSGYPYYLVWTADGQSVIFDLWDEANSRDTLWTADVHAQTAATQIIPDLRSIWSLGSARAGAIFFMNQDAQGNFTTYIWHNGKGFFEFSDAALSPGENIFTAVSSDAAGNNSAVSDAVSVTFDVSRLPDLAASADEVYLYPPYPIAGRQMSVNAVVSNTGGVDASNVDVVVYAWNARNQLEMLASETIPSLPAGSSSLITATWDSTGKTGVNRLVVVVDPNDTIAESNESNNMAIKDFYVADHAGTSMSTALDHPQYGSNQNANIATTIWNTGPSADAVLDARIEDTSGNPVLTYDTKTIRLAYGAQSIQNFVWNTGSTYAGPYVVHSVLRDAAGTVLAENTTPFTIIADATDDLIVATDKAAYGPGESVVTSFTIKNAGTNYIIPALQAAVSITDALGTVLFSEIKTASNLMSGSSIDLSSLWNTGLMKPGKYTVIVTVSFDGGPTTTKTAAFTINSLLVLTGTITAQPAVVSAGNVVQLTYTIANSGNTDAVGYAARISIIDPETQTVILTQDEPVDLAENTSKSGQVMVSTSGYGLKTYTAVLQSLYQGTTKNIANASFTVKDLTPPVVTIITPAASASYSSTVSLAVLAADDASGVNTVEYQLDSGQWKLLPVVDPAGGSYGASWTPTPLDNGQHLVNFRATDKAGNTSLPVPVGFAVQINTLPPIAVITGTPSSPTDETGATLLVGGTDVVAYKYRLDSGSYSAETAVSAPILLSGLSGGIHSVSVTGRNSAGSWQSESNATTTTWTVDVQPPTLALSTLPDGSVTNNATLNIAGTATDNIAVQTATVNDTAVILNPDGSFSQAISLARGTNTITIVATDTAGNTTTDVRTITLDQTAPTITITDPADNSLTNNADLTVTGTVDKPSTISIKVNGASSLPEIISGATFTFPVTLAYDRNTIEVTATDIATNSSTAKRTVIFDNISPALAVTNPAQDSTTNQANILLQGTVADLTGTTVTVTLDGTVYTPEVTSGAFQQQLTFTAEKTYAVIVFAADAAGNTTMVQRNIIYDTTPPALTINPVVTPTNSSIQTLSGTMEAGATVTVTGTTVSVGVVSYPTTTAWQAVLSDMTEGDNTVSVTAADLAGNVSGQVTATIVLDTQAPDTIIQNGPAALTNSSEAGFFFTFTEYGSTFECRLDNGVYSECAGPANYTNLMDGAHTFMVRAIDPAGNTDPTPASFTWIVDTIPPVAVVAGTPASPTRSTAALFTVSGADVVTYKYQFDNGTYSGETLVTVPVLLTGLSDGIHAVAVVGKDSAGNWQKPEFATIAAWLVDTTPPVLTLSALANGASTNNATLNVAGTVTDDVGVQGITINDTAVTVNADGTFSQAIKLMTGSNRITTIADDTTGNTATDTRTIILDQSAPVITITNPVDNSVTNEIYTMLTGTIDKTATVSVKVNNGSPEAATMTGNAFSMPITYVYGQNTIEVTATDAATNAATAKRTVTYDNASPALAVTDPAQDVITNQPALLLQGTVADLTGITVTVELDGTVYTPAVASGTFQQQLTFTTEKQYAAIVIATDAAGNTSRVQRNVIYDKTPPALTINPVTTPTNNNNQQLSGTREFGSTVTISCPTASAGVVSYPTATAWQTVLAGMTEGDNLVSVTATDPAGNVSAPVNAMIVLDTKAPVTTATPLAGAYNTGLTVTLTTNEPAKIYFTTDGAVPSTGSPVYSAPIIIAASSTVRFFAIDTAGNREAVKSAAYTINNDVTPPVTVVTTGNPSYSSPDGKLYVTSATIFTLSAMDNLSGVARTEYRIDSGNWTPYAPFTAGPEGRHIIGYRSVDNSGNVETTKTLAIIVDNTPPVSTIHTNGTKCQKKGSLTVATPITLTAVDTLSGVGLTEYNIDGGSWTLYNAAFTLSGYREGQHTIGYRSTDRVGNVEAAKSIVVQLTRKNTTLTYTGPALIARGGSATLSGTLRVDGMRASYPSGRTITFTLGAGPGSQSCTGTTDGKGKASCTIGVVTVPVGETTVAAAFSGDSVYKPLSDSERVIVFAYPSAGSFVVGDRSAAAGNAVTFWGAQWSRSNSLSSGSAPSSFKGYADSNSTTPPVCGGGWTSNPGNSSNLPGSVPAYMAVLVSSSINKSGSTITGNVTEVVVVQTRPGYGPDPAHAGTGTVVGVLCHNKQWTCKPVLFNGRLKPSH